MTFSPGPVASPTTSPPTETSDAQEAVAPAPSRVQRFIRGNADDPTWARPALFALLAATALLYTYGLTSNGWANSFYSAAVQAGSESWKAFFFGSSDAGNSITVDKPPAALWVMALSVRVFGLSSFAILFPEVLMGVATVGVVYASVRRWWGAAAGLIAGAVMALTPVAVLMFRFNNPDALLVLLMALGAWATMRSIERGSARWFALAGVFIGLGFLTKTLQVLLVVPFFGIAYLVAADTTLRRRIIGAAAGVGTMLLSAGWWVAIVELIPANMRPYIGGSQTNSFLELTFGYNGLGRINGEETGSVGGGGGWGTTGLGRMFSSSIGGQISWLIPSALILLAVGLWIRGRAPRTDIRRAGYIVWGGWLVVTMLTFSLMAGIFHEYYTVALAPAVAALVGMGSAEAWERRSSWLGVGALAAATAAAAIWSFVLLSRTTAYGDWLRVSVLALGITAALGFLLLDRLHRRAVPAVIATALIAALAGPTAYSLTTVNTSYTGSIITAGPSTGGMGGPGGGGMPGGGTMPTMPGGTAPGGSTQGGTGMPGGQTGGTAPTGGGGMGGLLDASTPSTEVVAALSEGASNYRWVAAAIGSQNAAGLQLGSGLPVMAIGGFNGSDPSPTLAQFQDYVDQGLIHYFAASGNGGGRGGGMGGSGTASEISTWVQANFTAVTIDGIDVLRPHRADREHCDDRIHHDHGDDGMTTVLDVVVPVHNEQATVGACVRRLHAHLVATFPYPFRITVADNASTDATWATAQALADELPGVRALHLTQKGRGRALKQAWLGSDALVLAYMDVDLSTDLDALWPLVAPLMSGHSDVAIGSRLARGSRVVRGTQREVISRCYNLVLRGALGVRFTDAQCGFKAIRGDVARELLPLVEDPAWFFDTELLVLAERAQLRIHEVPVDWYDDPDSRVDVVNTARDDLRGVWRMRRTLSASSAPVAAVADKMGRRMPGARVARQAASFAVIGVASTVLHLGLFALLRQGLASAALANALALLLATIVNTSWNRHWTFGLRGREGAGRQQVQALVVFAITLALTTAGLGLLHAVAPGAPTWLETAAVAITTALSTALKFVLMRTWIFAPASAHATTQPISVEGGEVPTVVVEEEQHDRRVQFVDQG